MTCGPALQLERISVAYYHYSVNLGRRNWVLSEIGNQVPI